MTTEKNVTMLLAGLGIGAAAGVLFARCSGSDLRCGISKEAALRASQAKNYLKGQATGFVDGAAQTLQTGHDALNANVLSGRDAAHDLLDRARQSIDLAAVAIAKTNDDALVHAADLTRRAEGLIQTA